jgi:hypothetical protein
MDQSKYDFPPFKQLETEEDLLRMANAGCLQLFHVDLSFLKAALDAKGMPLTREGMLVLMVAAMLDIPDEHEGKTDSISPESKKIIEMIEGKLVKYISEQWH